MNLLEITKLSLSLVIKIQFLECNSLFLKLTESQSTIFIVTVVIRRTKENAVCLYVPPGDTQKKPGGAIHVEDTKSS